MGSTRRTGCNLVAGILAMALLAGCGCDGGGSTPAAPIDGGVPTAEGRWERVRGPTGGARGLQETAAVTVGDRAVLIAGVDYEQASVKGLVLEPGARRWRRAAPSGLWWRYGQSVVAAGHRVILWGGCCGPSGRGSKAPGAIYDVALDRWTQLPAGPTGNRLFHTAVWTGEEMILWGGLSDSAGGAGRPAKLAASGAAYKGGAAYEPHSGTWRRIATAPLVPRRNHVAVWTGEEMLVWGGSKPSRPPRDERDRRLYDGAAYDPEGDTWRPIAPTESLSAPTPILGAGDEPDLQAAWTGRQMAIWTGTSGALYDPERDLWERIPPPPQEIGEAHPGASAVWTGAELVIWGGAADGDSFAARGAAYDPEARRWRRLPEAPLAGRDRHAAIWTGEGMLVWGGCCHGNRYHWDGATWIPMPESAGEFVDPRRGITAKIPAGWEVVRDRLSGVVYPEQVLAAASYEIDLKGVSSGGCSPGPALRQMPAEGALVQVIEYTRHSVKRDRSDFPSRPQRLRYADGAFGPFECFGPSFMFTFREHGRAFQAHAWFDRDQVDREVRAEALRVVESFQSD